jgi:hypothetical protein
MDLFVYFKIVKIVESIKSRNLVPPLTSAQ